MDRSKQEISQLFGRFAAEQDVASWSIDGCNLWPMIRVKVGWILRGPHPPKRQSPLLNRIGNRLHHLFLADRSEDSRALDPSAQFVFLTYASRLVKGTYGELVNPVVDPLVERLRRHGVTSQILQLGKTPGRPAFPRKRVTIRKGVRKVQLPTEWTDTLISFFADWEQLPPAGELHEALEDLASRILHDADQWERLLSGYGDIIPMVDCWYHWNAMAFNIACARRGLPVVEVQHGHISNTHFAYGEWTTPLASQLMPTHAWAWGPSEAKVLRKMVRTPKKQGRVFVGGNLSLSCAQLQALGKAELAPADLEQISDLRQKYSYVGLITLQATFFPKKSLFDILRKELPDWGFILRPHRKHWGKPEAISASFGEVCRDGQFVMSATASAPLAELMQKCDGHLTGFSTCARDALGVGMATALIHEWGNACFDYEIEQGVIVPFESEQHVPVALRESRQISAERCRKVTRSLLASEAESLQATKELLALGGNGSVSSE